WRRQIDIGLEVGAERLFRGPAQGGEFWGPFVEAPDRDGGPATKQLEGARQVEPPVAVGKRVVLGAQRSCRIDQEHLRLARRAGGEKPIDGGEAGKRLEAAGLAQRQQQPLAPRGPRAKNARA